MGLPQDSILTLQGYIQSSDADFSSIISDFEDLAIQYKAEKRIKIWLNDANTLIESKGMCPSIADFCRTTRTGVDTSICVRTLSGGK